MPHKRHLVFAAFVAVLLMLLALSWFCGRLEPTGHRLCFEPGNASISPMFAMITRGRLETNYSPAPGVRLARVYIHTFYLASQQSIQPVSALRYRVGMWVAPILGRLGVRDKFCGGMIEMPTDTDMPVLWLGYRATNIVLYSDAVLVSDRGLRVPLTSGVGQGSSARREHLDCWRLPTLLTNRGKYRLTLPNGNQPLVTFVYD